MESFHNTKLLLSLSKVPLLRNLSEFIVISDQARFVVCSYVLDKTPKAGQVISALDI